MATQAEQIRELGANLTKAESQLQLALSRIADLESTLEKAAEREKADAVRDGIADERAARMRAELDATKDELRRALERIAVTEARNAALEERARGQEKTTDRGWQLWLAVLAFGFSLVSLLVTAALQLKK